MALDTSGPGLLRMALAVGVAQVERTVAMVSSPATAQSSRFSWTAVRNDFSFIFRRILDLYISRWVSRRTHPTFGSFLLFQFVLINIGIRAGLLRKRGIASRSHYRFGGDGFCMVDGAFDWGDVLVARPTPD